ncbi:putative phospholipid-transporting ATPase IF [Chionoecetes opilio]|uniref:Putative phospholipid-transporting ATPase IF n=1 Tax=Chionoecetes opilio TaxID=41210 RepID=A0A8J5BVP2_CHIOP|nr:putative phospholipid-transporting ATPase IF [Chionoecetes opilio]
MTQGSGAHGSGKGMGRGSQGYGAWVTKLNTGSGGPVWVLTGDKVETAVNIAYSCGHFKRFMTVLSLTGLQDKQHAASRLRQCSDECRDDASHGLVVDGASLVILLECLAEWFYEVCRGCEAVVCCRLSPRQKAEIVKLVKSSRDSPRCAAVGDGANDVSMLQEAHLGIAPFDYLSPPPAGVMGKEGRQAARCADVSLAKFRFLQKVLLVHGHWNYVRMATFVHFSFYKNVVFNTPMVFYSAWSAFSTQPSHPPPKQSVYESFILTVFNITSTTLPVMAYGLFEQDVPPQHLLARPHLYRRLSRNALLSWKIFLKWILYGLWHASVMYFGLLLACRDDTCGLPGGQTGDLYLFGVALGTLCTFVVNLKITLEANHYNGVFILSLIVTALLYALLYLMYSGIPTEPFVKYGIYFVYYRLFESPALNLACLLLGVTCLLPDLLDKAYTHITDREMKLLMQPDHALDT